MENTIAISAEGELDEEQIRVWETNHQKILTAINQITKYADTRFLPTITDISKATGLSRKCVRQHFKNTSSRLASERNEMFDTLQSEVLLKICQLAMNGNLQAAKLYLELIGKIQPKGKVTNAVPDTNVQINGMILNREIVQCLNQEQLKKIEDVIKSLYHPHKTFTANSDIPMSIDAAQTSNT
ncbi:MAG: hypothetical protein ACLQQ4_06910 [Bacteroidia bacterium]